MDERYKDENLEEHLDDMDRLKEESENPTIKEEAEELLDSAGEVIDDGLDAIKEKTGDLFSGVTSFASDAIDKVKDVGSDVVDGAQEFVSEGVDSVKGTVDVVPQTISETASDVADTGTEIITGAAAAAAVVAGSVFAKAKSAVSEGADLINESVEVVQETVQETIEPEVKSINDLHSEESSLIQNDIPPVLRPKDIFEKTPELPDERIEPARQKINGILETLKNNKLSQDYGILMYLITFLVVLLVVWQFIQGGFSIRLGVIFLLGAFFLIYRGAVKGVTKEVFDLKSKVQNGEINPVRDILSKANYVLSGIELNLKRISFTKWLYTLFTPFLLYGVAELWRGPFDTKTSFWLFLTGIVVSFVVWPLAFRSDVKQLESLEGELNEVRRTFL